MPSTDVSTPSSSTAVLLDTASADVGDAAEADEGDGAGDVSSSGSSAVDSAVGVSERDAAVRDVDRAAVGLAVVLAKSQAGSASTSVDKASLLMTSPLVSLVSSDLVCPSDSVGDEDGGTADAKGGAGVGEAVDAATGAGADEAVGVVVAAPCAGAGDAVGAVAVVMTATGAGEAVGVTSWSLLIPSSGVAAGSVVAATVVADSELVAVESLGASCTRGCSAASMPTDDWGASAHDSGWGVGDLDVVVVIVVVVLVLVGRESWVDTLSAEVVESVSAATAVVLLLLLLSLRAASSVFAPPLLGIREDMSPPSHEDVAWLDPGLGDTLATFDIVVDMLTEGTQTAASNAAAMVSSVTSSTGSLTNEYLKWVNKEWKNGEKRVSEQFWVKHMTLYHWTSTLPLKTS
jgi:hypothetical protein